MPFDSANNFAAGGEWQPSRIVLPNTIADASGTEIDPSSMYLHMVGVNTTASSRGVVEGYADSRSYPQSPDPVSPDLDDPDNWLRQMFNVGNDSEIITELATDINDDLPYPQVKYPLWFPGTKSIII